MCECLSKVITTRSRAAAAAQPQARSRQRVYSQPSVPQVMISSFQTTEALRAVLSAERDPAMSEVLLDMERARMTAEDLRGAAFVQSSHRGRRSQTWRDLADEESSRSFRMLTQMARAETVIETVRTGLWRALRLAETTELVPSNAFDLEPRTVARVPRGGVHDTLFGAGNFLTVALNVLREEDSEHYESEGSDGTVA